MRDNLCDITIVLDRSGSMKVVQADTIGSFNTFMDEQAKLPGDCTVSLTQFDHEFELLYEGKPVKEAPRLTAETFVPRGWTALLDAIGMAIVATGVRLAKMPEAERPGKVVFVILTDGEENRSHEYTRERIFSMIKTQREMYKWQFIYLGANQDAIAEATALGMSAGGALNFAGTKRSVLAGASNVSKNMRRYRSGGSAVADFSPEERATQDAANATA
jgi:hypothetical protein